jgi:TRAP transporter TAXI family solute receptor
MPCLAGIPIIDDVLQPTANVVKGAIEFTNKTVIKPTANVAKGAIEFTNEIVMKPTANVAKGTIDFASNMVVKPNGNVPKGTFEPPLKSIRIGTGEVMGIYYPSGRAISEMVNKESDQYGITASVKSTRGSVYNINAVLGGELDFGILQSDRQYQAYNGEAGWSLGGRRKDLRAVFSIHSKSITLIASAESGITSVADLRGKRVNIGNPGSGQLQNSKAVLYAFGIDVNSIKAEYVDVAPAILLLQGRKIDAFFYTVGHPNENIEQATSGRVKVNIIPIEGEGIDALLENYPYYTKTVIPGKLYPNTVNRVDVNSIGLKATLVTSKNQDEEVVYAVTKEVFDNLEDFKKMHPAYSMLTREDMLQGLSAPIHKGALKYYREADLMKHIDPKPIQ